MLVLLLLRRGVGELTSWREWELTHRLVSRAYGLGIISGSGSSSTASGRWRLFHVSFRGRRPYILNRKRREWGAPWHRLKYGHWPEWIWGFCGKCGPWDCCGATGVDHAPGCKEDPDYLPTNEELIDSRQRELYRAAPKMGDVA